MFRSRACKGPQPSKLNNGLRSPDPAREGAGPSAPPNPIGQYVTITNALKFCQEKYLFKIGEIGGICGFNFGI